tara:strand:+ start:545 stop:853 length:309 start_codon:yes stop_codon:yes gene_type:complete
MKIKPFWWDIDQVLAPTSPAGNMPANVDFVIVGTGVTGLSAALTIARQGRSVAVLDRGQPGFGASTRNGGICSGNIRPSPSALSNTHSPTFADYVYAEGITA